MNITKITGIKEGTRDRIRELVRIRDKHKCQKCKVKWIKGNRRLDVHHIEEKMFGKTNKKGTVKYDRKNMDKLITLCHKCHFSLPETRNRISMAMRHK